MSKAAHRPVLASEKGPRLRRRQEDRSRATREALIAAAIDCIADIGYHKTTTSVIARRAEVSRGALQHHFASRDNLIEAVIERVMSELHFTADPSRLAELPLDERVMAVIDNYQRVFGGKLFVAALSIWLGIMPETQLKERMGLLLREAQARFAAVWSVIFHDVDMSAEELMKVRRILMAAVRGYSIHELFGAPAGNWSEDSVVLKEAVTGMLARRQRSIS